MLPGAIVEESLLSLILRYADARQAQELLLAISGFFGIAAAVVKVIKRPISFGTAFIWQRLDALRDARIVPYWTLNVSTKVFKGLTSLVWIVCAIGVVQMARDPNKMMSAMTAPFTPDAFRQSDLARVSDFFDTVARGATPLLFGISAFVILMAFHFVYQHFVLRAKNLDIPDWFEKSLEFIIMPLVLYFAWSYGVAFFQDGGFIFGTFGPSFYQTFLVQISAFSVPDIFFVTFFGAFILTTTLLFAVAVWFITSYVFERLPKLLNLQTKLSRKRGRQVEPQKVIGPVYVFGAGVMLSFLATASAGRIGLSFGGALDVTLTFQLLAVNAFFDGLTLAATLKLMTWAAESFRAQTVHSRFKDYAESLKAIGTAHRLPDAANSPTNPRLRLSTRNEGDLFYWVSNNLIGDLLKWHEEGRLAWAKGELQALKDLRFSPERFAGLEMRSKLHGTLMGIATAHQPSFRELEKSCRPRLPIALLIDVVVAFIFCLAVLWLGLIGTPASLDWSSIWHVAIGGFKGGVFTELGPLFWITHTTFIPTLLIWAALLFMLFLCSGISRAVDRLIRLRPPKNVNAAAQVQIERARMALTKTAAFFTTIAGSIYALDFAGLWPFGVQ